MHMYSTPDTLNSSRLVISVSCKSESGLWFLLLSPPPPFFDPNRWDFQVVGEIVFRADSTRAKAPSSISTVSCPRGNFNIKHCILESLSSFKII